MTTTPTSAPIARRTFLAGCAASFASAVAPATAEPGLVGVVELFTSQGCSSCPPADAALASLAEDPRILALGYHVDYWDYLGWKDTLASPHNTERQRGYAATLGNRSVYTPQAVINGRAHVNGGKLAQIRTLIARHAENGRGLTVPVSVLETGGRLAVAVGAGAKPAGAEMLLTITFFRHRSQVEIARGENAGRTMTYANAVMAQQTLGMWDGQAMDVELPRSKIAEYDADGCAVLLQASIGGAPGPILGAANLTGHGRS